MSKLKTATQNSKLRNFYKEWRSTVLIGLGIFLLALFLRLANLTILPIFGDEAIYIRWSQVMGAEPGLRFLPLSDGKQPLFMWILMFLVRRFNDPLFIGRLTSVIYGMGTLTGISLLSYSLFRSKKIALISALFWAISPYSVFYDRLALVDSMLTMFGVWTLFFGVLTAKSKRLDFAMLTGFALGGALLTKSPALYFTLMLPLTWIVSNWPKRRKGRWVGKKELIHLIKLSSLYTTSLLIGYGMYNILRLGENFHLITSRNQDYIYPINHLWQDPLNPFITNITGAFNWTWKLGPSLIVVFALFVLLFEIKRIKFKKSKKPNSNVTFLFLWTTLPLIVTAVYARVFTARYILFLLPALFIFASRVFSDLLNISRKVKHVFVFGLIIFILQSFVTDFFLLTNPQQAGLPRVIRSGYLEEWTAGFGIKEVAELIKEEQRLEPDKTIVVGTEGYFGTLPDGLQAYLNDLPEVTIIGVGQPILKIPDSLRESKEFGNKTYLVVNSTRLAKTPGELGLEIVAVYPKAFRPDGSRESLYLLSLK